MAQKGVLCISFCDVVLLTAIALAAFTASSKQHE